MNWKTTLSLFLVFQIYLIIGMVAFHFLETENEDGVRQDMRHLKEEILANFTRDFTCLTSEDLESLIAALSHTVINGVDASNNDTNWGYGSAYFFSGTVITTIGYGHISPGSRAGRIFCIIYALIGIPICFTLLADLGLRFNKFKDDLLKKVCKFPRKCHHQKAFGISVILVVGTLMFIFIPAIIFQAIEGWTHYEALYYCAMTLTTIGLGDYVAGQNPDMNYPAIYQVATFYWIMLGLVFLTIIIQDISHTMSSQVKRLGIMTGEEDNLNKIERDTDYGGLTSSTHSVDERQEYL